MKGSQVHMLIKTLEWDEGKLASLLSVMEGLRMKHDSSSELSFWLAKYWI